MQASELPRAPLPHPGGREPAGQRRPAPRHEDVDHPVFEGEGFDRLAREMKVSRGTVVRAYDFANRDEAAAAAREGRKPTRPPSKWSEESRAAQRKPRDA